MSSFARPPGARWSAPASFGKRTGSSDTPLDRRLAITPARRAVEQRPATATPAAGDSLVLPGERHLRNVPAHVRRQQRRGDFSHDGKQLIFQRQEATERGCDQQYVIPPTDRTPSGSNGEGRTTCGILLDGDRRFSTAPPTSIRPPARRLPTAPRGMSGRWATSRSIRRSSMAATAGGPPRTRLQRRGDGVPDGSRISSQHA